MEIKIRMLDKGYTLRNIQQSSEFDLGMLASNWGGSQPDTKSRHRHIQNHLFIDRDCSPDATGSEPSMTGRH